MNKINSRLQVERISKIDLIGLIFIEAEEEVIESIPLIKEVMREIEKF